MHSQAILFTVNLLEYYLRERHVVRGSRCGNDACHQIEFTTGIMVAAASCHLTELLLAMLRWTSYEVAIAGMTLSTPSCHLTGLALGASGVDEKCGPEESPRWQVHEGLAPSWTCILVDLHSSDCIFMDLHPRGLALSCTSCLVDSYSRRLVLSLRALSWTFIFVDFQHRGFAPSYAYTLTDLHPHGLTP